MVQCQVDSVAQVADNNAHQEAGSRLGGDKMRTKRHGQLGCADRHVYSSTKAP